jgi:apolipoprotein N-acyltransferase
MNGRKFLAANAYIIGTIIILVGFIWMFTQAAIGVNIMQTLVAFFFTISGIIFWWIGYTLNPNKGFSFGVSEKMGKVLHH